LIYITVHANRRCQRTTNFVTNTSKTAKKIFYEVTIPTSHPNGMVLQMLSTFLLLLLFLALASINSCLTFISDTLFPVLGLLSAHHHKSIADIPKMDSDHTIFGSNSINAMLASIQHGPSEYQITMHRGCRFCKGSKFAISQ